jgi:hypothetical protein
MPSPWLTVNEAADRAELIFRGFLQKLFGEIEAGRASVPDRALEDASPDARKIVEDLRAHLDTLGNCA